MDTLGFIRIHSIDFLEFVLPYYDLMVRFCSIFLIASVLYWLISKLSGKKFGILETIFSILKYIFLIFIIILVAIRLLTEFTLVDSVMTKSNYYNKKNNSYSQKIVIDEEKSVKIPEGQYDVGIDIPVGKYELRNMYQFGINVTVYPNKESTKEENLINMRYEISYSENNGNFIMDLNDTNKNEKLSERVDSGDSIFVKLDEGNVLDISGPCEIKVFKGFSIK